MVVDRLIVYFEIVSWRLRNCFRPKKKKNLYVYIYNLGLKNIIVVLDDYLLLCGGGGGGGGGVCSGGGGGGDGCSGGCGCGCGGCDCCLL